MRLVGCPETGLSGTGVHPAPLFCPRGAREPAQCCWAWGRRLSRRSLPPSCLSAPRPLCLHAPSCVQRVSNIVFMGMGEPLLNLPSVLRAHEILNKDVGIGEAHGVACARLSQSVRLCVHVKAACRLRWSPASNPRARRRCAMRPLAGARHITISTVGVPNAIRRMGRLAMQSTLAVSIHAPNQVCTCCEGSGPSCDRPPGCACALRSFAPLAAATPAPVPLNSTAITATTTPPPGCPHRAAQALREQIVPSARAYPLDALMADCQEYFRWGSVAMNTLSCCGAAYLALCWPAELLQM